MKLSTLILFFLAIKICAAQPMPDSLGYGLNAQVSYIYSDTLNDNIIVCGSYSLADNKIAIGIAKYNGNEWDTLHCSFVQYCGPVNPNNFGGQFTNAVVPYQGHLYFAGVFEWAGGIHTGGIAMLDSDTLKAVGGYCNGQVTQLIEYQGDLIAAGYFDTIGGQRIKQFARWDGENWYPFYQPYIDTCMSTTFAPSDMAIYQGELYMSGGWMDCYPGLGSLVKWNGSEWSVIPGFNAQAQIGVTDIEVYQDKLIIAGRFHKAGGYEGNCIMAWDGQQFYDMENGITALSTPQQYWWGGTNDMKVVGDKLFIVGQFPEVGGSPISTIAWWDGNHWCGFNLDYSQFIPNCIGHIGNDIYIGSRMYRFINGIDYNYIIKLPPIDSANICSDGTLASVSTQPYNNQIKIFPNPVTDNLTLEYNLDKTSNFKFALYDVLGNIVYQEENPTAYGYYHYLIPTQNLAQGLYIARIELNGKTFAKKVLKQ